MNTNINPDSIDENISYDENAIPSAVADEQSATTSNNVQIDVKKEQKVNAELLLEVQQYLQSTQIPQRVRASLEELNSYLAEREELLGLMLVTIFSKQHIFLLGLPGCGKSYVMDYMKQIVTEASLFEKLFTEQMKETEVLGDGGINIPISDTIGGCYFALLDELFKAPDQLLNSLLRVLNERELFVQGKSQKIPLSTAFTASNEVSNSTIAKAFVDRLLLWYEVLPLSKIDQRLRFTQKQFKVSSKVVHNTFTQEEVAKIAHYADKAMILSDELAFKYIEISESIRRSGIYCSDRKFGPDNIGRAIGVSALLNNRLEINYSDLCLIQHFTWTHPSERATIIKTLTEVLYNDRVSIERSLRQLTQEYKEINSPFENSYFAFLTFQEDIKSILDFDEKLEAVKAFRQKVLELRERFQEIVNDRLRCRMIDEQCKENIFVIEHFKNPYNHPSVQEGYESLDAEFEARLCGLDNFLSDVGEEFHSYQLKRNENAF